MASSYTLTRNLKLRLDSNLTASARSNLEKIDLLGSTFLVDSANTLKIRSTSDILIEPESSDLGGSAVGGTLTIGSSGHRLSSVVLNTSSLQLSSGISILDQASGGTRYLAIQYKSDISGLTDTTSDRVMSVDLQSGDRSLVLSGNYSQVGGSLVLNLTGDTTLTLPTVGTLATLSGTETLTGKTINATNNTIQGITDASISVAAGIVYSKLDITGGIRGTDISPTAQIPYSTLALSSSITDSDISPAAAVGYSKLNLSGQIVDSDVSSSAAIAGTKVIPQFGARIVSTTQSFRVEGLHTTDIAAAGSGQIEDLTFHLPADYGSTNQVLSTDGSGNLSWVDRTSGGGGGGDVNAVAVNWIAADGTTKTVNHGLASTDVDVTVIDDTHNEVILVDSIAISGINSIILTSSEVPSGTWRIIVQGQ